MIRSETGGGACEQMGVTGGINRTARAGAGAETETIEAAGARPSSKTRERFALVPADDTTTTTPAQTTIDTFLEIDIRTGRVLRAEPFPAARRPAIKLWIDFGDRIGVKASSAQITDRYCPADLIGRTVLAVVNFPPRRIAGFVSEVLVLGVPTSGGDVVLIQPDQEVEPGLRLL